MAYRSLLILQTAPGARDEAVEAYHKRQILEECAAAIPEFIAGRVGLSQTDPDRICVEVDWSDPKGWHDWLEHPVRAVQASDITEYFVSILHSDVYEL